MCSPLYFLNNELAIRI